MASRERLRIYAQPVQGQAPQPRVTVVRGQQEQLVRQSTLFEMSDGRFCAVCMTRGAVKSILLLAPATAGAERSRAAQQLERRQLERRQ